MLSKMSKATPRKPRHRQHPSNSGHRQQIHASDYESDTAYYMENRNMAPQAPSKTRSDMEVNLTVLRRYDQTIKSVLAIAANAVIYTIGEATAGWEKHGVEGTLFVCEQEPRADSSGQYLPQYSIFILNRRGMNNFVVDLTRISNCEVVEELIVFQLEDGYTIDSNETEEGAQKAIGIWMHEDETRPRTANFNTIMGAWQEARTAGSAYLPTDDEGQGAPVAVAETPAPQPIGLAPGRQIDINDLFGKK
ncbi:hypothetical protein B0T21DRAFT_367508 [Apiosordaria backusii]|uniref:Uncharacterized protein n=1 Tax=Apiosordaria backusii TaxID=314023 RepID=A0AA40EF72_9PEZI|nr:hypothetical protein B0T21DRAFT_367508 [Apiosordaria backusii]